MIKKKNPHEWTKKMDTMEYYEPEVMLQSYIYEHENVFMTFKLKKCKLQAIHEKSLIYV